MANYYGVERSAEYLEHYGVRGMKWGVRKAIARGDKEALSRHYRKATLTLAKLSLKANQDLMRKRYQQAKSNMITGAIGSAGMSAALTAAANGRASATDRAKISAIAGLGGAAAGALANSRGIMSGRYASDKGHAKAIAKRNAFRKELDDTFKNSGISKKEMQRYHNQITALSNQKNPLKYTLKLVNKAPSDTGKIHRKRRRNA